MKNGKFCWGIIGCGKIAHQFAISLSVLPQAELLGVASKSGERAESFARKYNAGHWFDSYRDLARMPELDAVYVATTHNFHYENSMLCIDHGKGVLCEKPLTVTAREAERLISHAISRKVFLMEAFWTRFLPSTKKLLELLDRKVIGEVKMVKADFGYNFPFDAISRVYDPGLAGGALLDVGVYPINLAQQIFRSDPVDIQSSFIMSPTHIDEQSSYIFRYEGSRMAVLYAAVNVETRHDAWIYGTEGIIHMPRFYCASKLHVSRSSGEKETLELPFVSTGYSYEAEEVMRCMGSGKIESDIMPHRESLGILKIMDKMRQSWGLIYPADLIERLP
ncbi:MAG: Gfo/Idh/MocA family oxidoreductase [Cyclobacteriaceae bacterium]|nr:Gfo/Idh/MocA family oxidoreductase [Cyclobacteriaceae bacterium]